MGRHFPFFDIFGPSETPINWLLAKKRLIYSGLQKVNKLGFLVMLYLVDFFLSKMSSRGLICMRSTDAEYITLNKPHTSSHHKNRAMSMLLLTFLALLACVTLQFKKDASRLWTQPGMQLVPQPAGALLKRINAHRQVHCFRLSSAIRVLVNVYTTKLLARLIITSLVIYHRGKFLERDKFDVDKFGSPTSYQIFPSILRMRCVKGQQPSRGHQEITAAIHYEATARDLIPNFSFISKDQFQMFPPLILALPKKTPQIIPPVVLASLLPSVFVLQCLYVGSFGLCFNAFPLSVSRRSKLRFNQRC